MPEHELYKRLEKLERDNTRLKRIMVGSLALVAALCVIYAASCSSLRKATYAQSIPQKIKAHEFDVVDSAGKVRISLKVSEPKDANSSEEISLFDSSGKERVSMENTSDFDWLHFLGDDKNDVLRIGGNTIAGGSSDIELFGGPAVGPMGLSPTGWGTQQISLSVTPQGQPLVSLSDAKGFSVHLGSTDLVTPATGTTQKTSAASIVMFGNDKRHRVIWQAP